MDRKSAVLTFNMLKKTKALVLGNCWDIKGIQPIKVCCYRKNNQLQGGNSIKPVWFGGFPHHVSCIIKAPQEFIYSYRRQTSASLLWGLGNTLKWEVGSLENIEFPAVMNARVKTLSGCVINALVCCSALLWAEKYFLFVSQVPFIWLHVESQWYNVEMNSYSGCSGFLSHGFPP